MQCACAVLYCHLWPVRLYHIFLHYRTIFWDGELLNTERVLEVSPQHVLNISHSKWNSAKYKRKLPVVLSHFNNNLKIIGRFATNPEISNFMKIRPVGAELLRTD